MTELKSSIKDTKKDIDNLLNTKFIKISNTPERKVRVNITFVDSSKINQHTEKNDYHYEIGKLYDRHPIFGISFFRKSFNDNDKIIHELDNMEKNFNSDLEYYCSLELIKQLIEELT